MKSRQAIYPTILIVIVALKQSPMDAERLSLVVHEARGRSSGMVVGGMSESDTIVFHRSTFHTTTGVETEGGTEGSTACVHVH